ncbi:MAG TPA: hypothetical protein VGY54_06730 [Polyangiaceae bacterium]|jgi:hypothetical protein|nr:hypothetical protein [Polyangiaceae bacterium]
MKKKGLCTLCALAVGFVLAQSERADAATPTTAECLSAADSSLQLRGEHKLRAARAQVLICASPSCPAAIQTVCLGRVDQINAALPTVVFEAKDPLGNDLPNVRATMDGQPLADRLDGSALTVDPGEHKFTFVASDNTVVEKTIIIHEGEKDRRERVVFGSQAGPQTAAVATAPPLAVSPVEAGPSQDPGAGRRTLGLVIGGVGVAGIAVGSVFGLLASSSASSSKNAGCPNCTQAQYTQATSDYNSASDDATISTVAFIVGGAAVGAGAILFFTAPKATTTGIRWQLAPTAFRAGAGLTLGGTL